MSDENTFLIIVLAFALLALLIFAFVHQVQGHEPCPLYEYGDLNCDNEISPADALKLLDLRTAIVRNFGRDLEYFQRQDLEKLCDGVMNMADVEKLGITKLNGQDITSPQKLFQVWKKTRRQTAWQLETN